MEVNPAKIENVCYFANVLYFLPNIISLTPVSTDQNDYILSYVWILPYVTLPHPLLSGKSPQKCNEMITSLLVIFGKWEYISSIYSFLQQK